MGFRQVQPLGHSRRARNVFTKAEPGRIVASGLAHAYIRATGKQAPPG